MKTTDPQITTSALLLTVINMLLMLHVSLVAGLSAAGLLGESPALPIMVLQFVIAGLALLAALALFSQPRRIAFVALIAATLSLWLGLYLVVTDAGFFTLDSPLAMLYVWPAAFALVTLLPVLKIWLKLE